MSRYRVLIVGDSRTRHLEGFLNNTTLNIRYTVITVPGATLHKLATVTVNTLSQNFSYHLIIIAGGINDLSMLRYIPSKHARPRFNSVETLVNHTVGQMRRCIDYVSDYLYMPVALAALSGMNLSQYSPQLHDFLYTYQPIVDRAIVEINHRVRGKNRMNSLRSPDLSSAVNRCIGNHGRYRTHYTYPFDGLHPGYMLRRILSQNIHTHCARIFPEITHIQYLANDYW